MSDGGRLTVDDCHREDLLICPQCLAIHGLPFDAGDQCICGGRMADYWKCVSEWKRIFNLVGSIVAEARIHRGNGGHHLAVYGAIGKCLIDRDEFDAHAAALRSAQRDGKCPGAHTEARDQ